MSLRDFNRHRSEGAQAAAVIVVSVIIAGLLIAALGSVVR